MRGQFLLAYRYLTVRKQRFILTTLAIVFGVMILFGMNAVLPGVMNSFRHTMITAAGKVDLTISSATNNPFDGSLFETIQSVKGISASTGSLIRNVQIPESMGGKTDPISGSAAIVLTGVDVNSAQAVRKYLVSSGRFLQPDDTNQAVLGYYLAQKLGKAAGETLTLPSSSGTTALTIVGIMDQLASSATIDEVFVNLPEAQRILNLPGQINQIELILKAYTDPQTVTGDLMSILGPGFKVGSVEVGNELGTALELGQKIMSIFGVLALAMASFIIFNTFRTVVAERRRDLGMLRAIGASRKTIMGLIVTESLIQGVIGSLAGLVLGYLLSLGILDLMQPIVQSYLRANVGTPVVTPGNLISSSILGIGLTLASGYFPARSAMKVTPLEALRPTTAALEQRNLRVRSITGFSLMVLSVAGLIFGDLSIASVSMLLFLIGLILITPVLVKPVAALFGSILSRIYRHQGNIAQGNLTRQVGRASVTASAMMIGIAITIAMVGLITSAYDGFLGYLDKSLGADYLLMPQSLILGGGNLGAAPEFVEDLRKIDGLSGVTSLRLASSKVKNTDLQIIGIDPELYPGISGLEFSKGDEKTAYKKLGEGRSVIVNGIFSTSVSVKVGDSLMIQTMDGEHEYKVVAVAMDYLNAKLATAYISQANLERDFHVSSDVLIMANRGTGANKAEVDDKVNEEVKKYPAFTLIDANAFKESQKEVFKSAFGAFYALILVLAIPGLIAMANTLNINVIERTREIGMLRAVGSTRRQIKQMILSESLLLSALGVTVGIAVGLFLSYYMLKAMTLSGFVLKFFFPGYGILVAIFVGFLFGIIAAMLPARQAAKTVIVEALRYE